MPGPSQRVGPDPSVYGRQGTCSAKVGLEAIAIGFVVRFCRMLHLSPIMAHASFARISRPSGGGHRGRLISGLLAGGRPISWPEERRSPPRCPPPVSLARSFGRLDGRAGLKARGHGRAEVHTTVGDGDSLASRGVGLRPGAAACAPSSTSAFGRNVARLPCSAKRGAAHAAPLEFNLGPLC